MTIRQATPDDYDRIGQLFADTILHVNIRHYTPGQVQVWSARVRDKPRWLAKIAEQHFLLVEAGKELRGMGSITPGGYLDLMYVSHLHQGKGIARRLIEELEAFARRQQVPRIRSDVSITARPFFEHVGFRVIAPQKIEINDLIFDNFIMEKIL